MAQVRSLCVYCGSSARGRDSHHQAARQLGRLMAEARVRLVYGGGRIGLMGLIADAVLQGGGEVVGIIPRFLDQVEVGHSGVSRLIVTENMHERKEKMAELSDAFVILPGGLGTLDETFEILTWKQLQLHDKPVLVVDVDGYWQPLVDLVDRMIEENYAKPEHRALFRIVAGVDEVLPALAEMPEFRTEIEAKWM
ncbi:MAG: TIGR00730 family Rossman fold protein [Rhodospirillales bacterium]|nr:MAG: TIGR00730 family Rossman fold protein [Rhodospirillales bacterium]